jgi:hypothetical protein
MPKFQNLTCVLSCFHAASLVPQPAAVLIDKLYANIALTNASFEASLMGNLPAHE